MVAPDSNLTAVQKNHDEEPKKELKYPKSVFFIISNEFCERFSYYGMRTILALYLSSSLHYSEDMSTIIYHVFVMLCYFTPLIGGIMADSWLGKYRTILYVSILYAIGNIVLAIGSVSSLNISHRAMSLVGLFLIALGTGGIKPCVSSFGGDQFKLPEQEKQLESFFSVFYFTINAGSVLSCFFTPMLRENVKCLGSDKCDPLAFGVPAILMIISVVCFVAGKYMYKMKDPEGNIMALVCKCIWHAIVRKHKVKKTEKKAHWLDYADDKYSLKLIEETKIFLNLAYLFSPTIVFWALYEQQGSRWTFQASHMNGYTWGYNLDPDQVQTLNPVLVLIFIPIFDKLFYPFLAKVRLVRTPLQKLSWGGLLAALAFLVSGFLELSVQDSYPLVPKAGEAHLRIFSNVPCDVSFSQNNILGNDLKISEMSMLQKLNVPVTNSKTIQVNLTSKCYRGFLPSQITLNEEEISNYLITNVNGSLDFVQLTLKGTSEIDKSNTTKINPKFKVIYGKGYGKEFKVEDSSSKFSFSIPISEGFSSIMYDNVTFGKYNLSVDGRKVVGGEINLETGGVYTILLGNNTVDGSLSYESFTITNPNKVHMLWQIPQYFIITFAEIMFSITGMEFSFTQSPDSMKSVVSSLWLITDAFGNIIILIIAGISIFDSKAYELFLYAAIMVVVMILFIILAMRYKYVTKMPEDPVPEEPLNSTNPANTLSTVES